MMNTHLTGNVFDPASEKFKKGYIKETRNLEEV